MEIKIVPHTINGKAYLPIKEFAWVLQKSEQSIRAHINKKAGLKYIKSAGTYFIPISEIDGYGWPFKGPDNTKIPGKKFMYYPIQLRTQFE